MGRAMIDFGRFAQLCGHWADMRRLNKGAALDDARPPLPRFSNEALLFSQSAVLKNKQGGRTQQ
jgi:hypothetical protein